jgi:hypothetical protein
MNFMQPELIARTRSDDDDIADAASEEWECKISEYNRHIEEIKPQLTEAIRLFLDAICLHDTHFVRAVHNPAERKLTLLFEDRGRQKKFLISYFLLGIPIITRHPGSLAVDEADFHWVLYDEIDLFPDNRLRAFTHSILLTGGWELRLLFSDMKITRHVEVYDPNRIGEMVANYKTEMVMCE